MDKQHCECCGRELDANKIVWLELNHKTGKWSDPRRGEQPPSESQGAFPFGAACAKRRLAEQQT